MLIAEGGSAVRPIYRINDVAERFGVSKSTLRQWEQHGLITPHRAPSGYRRYTDTDVRRIGHILRMRQIEGLNIAAIAAVLRGSDPAEGGTRSARSSPAASPGTGSQLGERLRTLRRRRGLSLSQAAAQAGISRSALSLLERTSQGVSPATTRTLAEVYGLTVTDLMASPGGARTPVVRSGQAQALPTLGPGISISQLSSIPNAVMLCQIWTIQPGAGSQGSYAHEGEEFIYVLTGTFEITLDGEETHALTQGDSIYFESWRHHSWCNPDKEETRILWVITPPTY
jgi:DNA-binding transcriptional MerR regulator/quercetin dioxygenase-like cupin family protein